MITSASSFEKSLTPVCRLQINSFGNAGPSKVSSLITCPAGKAQKRLKMFIVSSVITCPSTLNKILLPGLASICLIVYLFKDCRCHRVWVKLKTCFPFAIYFPLSLYFIRRFFVKYIKGLNMISYRNQSSARYVNDSAHLFPSSSTS